MNIEQLRQIKTFHSLVRFLRDELDWPIDSDDVEDITFEYDPAELGFDASEANLIKEIKQLRPLDSKQPWGIFWVDFEKKKLPVVVLRRVLGHLVVKKRASASRSSQPAWHLNDLLFLSAYGEDHDRAITLAHFWQNPENPTDLPVLKVLGWDGGDTVLHLADAYRTLSDHLRWPDDPSDLETWRSRWTSAFPLRHREVIETTQQLVSELARLATDIRKRTGTLLARESKIGPLRRLYSSFQATLIHDLTEEDFADVIAQTVTYGLLAAKFSHRSGISVSTLVDMVPRTNPFLRELLGTFLSLAGRKGTFDFDELGFHEVVDLLNHANTDAVKADFGNRTRNEDPVIHFYEHFLTAYDKKMKIKRGIFYTPQPVVSYIVRSVHELLQTEFGIEDGLASTITWGEMQKRMPDLKIPDGVSPDEFFVNVLDPATGTATFLVEIIEVIFNHLINKWEKDGPAAMPVIPNQQSAFEGAQFKDYWNSYVPHALLPRLYGYELMMAPYTIAHMKFGLKLSEINTRLGQPDYEMEFEGRAHIYLTNSLEPPSDLGQQDLVGIFPALAHEAQAVNAVKRHKRFTVVIGNPPYSNFGQLNRIPFILQLLTDYKHGLDERKINLDDDYIKFIRFGHYLIDLAHSGVCSMITNNVFVDGITHRQMRCALRSSFSLITVCDLHGSVKKLEKAPDGSKDENVFDIQQGVGIMFLVKLPAHPKTAVCFSELWGRRDAKYATLGSSVLDPAQTAALLCDAPYYFFTPKVFAEKDLWSQWLRIPDAMPIYATGVKTHLDDVFVGFSRQEIDAAIAEFLEVTWRNVPISSAKRASPLRKALLLKKALHGSSRTAVTDYAYRAFDTRKVAYLTAAIEAGDHRYPVMKHLLSPNIALVTTRQLSQGSFSHVLVTRSIADMCLLSTATKECAYVFPLRRVPEEGLLQASGDSANLSQATRDFLGQFGGRPDDFLQYAYAILHSSSYRARYAEFLKIDFPRVPLMLGRKLFRELAYLGGELVALHLMESPKLDTPITKWQGITPSNQLEKITYSDETVWIDKAKGEGFRGVPEEVWNFHIGGYQVCEKWLKDRRGRRLSEDNITHYQKIVVALSETIRLMTEIDKVIDAHGGWPGAFTTDNKP